MADRIFELATAELEHRKGMERTATRNRFLILLTNAVLMAALAAVGAYLIVEGFGPEGVAIAISAVTGTVAICATMVRRGRGSE